MAIQFFYLKIIVLNYISSRLLNERFFLQEMSLVAEAVFNAFKPVKMNYELLGNSDSHLHWHLFPRHQNDPLPRGPVWLIDKELRNGDSARPTKEELIVLRDKLQHELSRLEILFKSL